MSSTSFEVIRAEKRHVEKLIAEKLWLSPIATVALFRKLFGVPSTRKARLFLEASVPSVLPDELITSFAANLNTPKVIAAYRQSVVGIRPTSLLGAGETIKYSRKHRLENASIPIRNAIAKDVSKLLKRAATGHLVDVLPLRSRLNDWLSSHDDASLTGKSTVARDELLLRH